MCWCQQRAGRPAQAVHLLPRSPPPPPPTAQLPSAAVHGGRQLRDGQPNSTAMVDAQFIIFEVRRAGLAAATCSHPMLGLDAESWEAQPHEAPGSWAGGTLSAPAQPLLGRQVPPISSSQRLHRMHQPSRRRLHRMWCPLSAPYCSSSWQHLPRGLSGAPGGAATLEARRLGSVHAARLLMHVRLRDVSAAVARNCCLLAGSLMQSHGGAPPC